MAAPHPSGWEVELRPTAGDLVRWLAAQHGQRVVAVRGRTRMTYEALEVESRRIAAALLAEGVGKGTRVGLLAPNGPDWIAMWLGAARTGAVVVLLNTYSKGRELDWMLRHADVAVLLAVAGHLGHDYVERLEAVVDGLAPSETKLVRSTSHPYLRSIWLREAEDLPTWAGSFSDLLDRGSDVGDDLVTAVEAEVTPADPMVVVYSSGSTSDPKGAVHTHGSVIRHARNLSRFRDLGSEAVVYSPMPMFWVGGLTFALVRALHAGATLVFEDRFDPGATLELLERERVTHVLGWPHMEPALTGHTEFARRDLSAIRGGSLPGLLPEHLRPSDPGRVAGSLGMTETLGPHLIDREGAELPEDKRGSFGRSVPGMEHRVVDPATGDELPVGELGELWVRGYALMAGLHKREREDVFTPDGWYPTGDGGWLDADGHFFFKGRLGDQIKSGGMNITPREVELVLEVQPEVRRAIVAGIDSERGQDVAAAVVLVPGSHLDAEQLRARVAQELASYKVPRHVAVLVSDDDLPWLDSGKVDVREVGRMLAERFGAT